MKVKNVQCESIYSIKIIKYSLKLNKKNIFHNCSGEFSPKKLNNMNKMQ